MLHDIGMKHQCNHGLEVWQTHSYQSKCMIEEKLVDVFQVAGSLPVNSNYELLAASK
jgi:hypothetical protein